MSATWNVRRMLRWTTLAGLLAATLALGATPAAAHDNDWNYRPRHHNKHWSHYNNGYGYGYYQPRYHYRERRYYYYPAPTYYYYPPPVYYYPRPYYRPSFSFGLTIPID